MKNILKIFVLFACMYSLPDEILAQGCSDAGFCTLNSFKPKEQSDFGSQFKLGASLGKADQAIQTIGAFVEFDKQIGAKFGFDVKLTALSQNGNQISNFGLSDLYVNTNYRIGEKSRLTLGVKIPLSDGNVKENEKSLPMDYQPSLGTYDLILGATTSLIGIQLAAAVQFPLTQNKNEYFSTQYPTGTALGAFQTTNKFKRSGDIMLRVSYPINMGGKLSITPSVLPIYHLANDKYTDISGAERVIAGSHGLTLNGNLYFDYLLSDKSAVQLNVGAPFVVRDARPDGLTRSFIATLEYRFTF